MSIGYQEVATELIKSLPHASMTSMEFAASTSEQKAFAGCDYHRPEFETFFEIQERSTPSKPGVYRSFFFDYSNVHLFLLEFFYEALVSRCVLGFLCMLLRMVNL